jgi:hypothetical protein
MILGDSANTAAIGGLCVVDAAPDSLATRDAAPAYTATAAPCGRIALDASARCVWEAEAGSDCVCSCATSGALRAGSTGCTNVRAATDVSAAGRSISEKTTAALAVAPIAAAATKRRVVRRKFGAWSEIAPFRIEVAGVTHQNLRGKRTPPAPMSEPSPKQPTQMLQSRFLHRVVNGHHEHEQAA